MPKMVSEKKKKLKKKSSGCHWKKGGQSEEPRRLYCYLIPFSKIKNIATKGSTGPGRAAERLPRREEDSVASVEGAEHTRLSLNVRHSRSHLYRFKH